MSEPTVDFGQYKNFILVHLVAGLYVLSKKYAFPRVDILGSWKYHFLSWKDGMKKMPKIYRKIRYIHIYIYI